MRKRMPLSEHATNWPIGSDMLTGEEYIDIDGYLDDPNKKGEIEKAISDDEWEWRKDMTRKDVENDYSWDRFEHKPIKVGGKNISRRAIPLQIDNEIEKRNNEKYWTEEDNDNDMVYGFLHNESIRKDNKAMRRKQTIRLTESDLKMIIKESVNRILNELTM